MDDRQIGYRGSQEDSWSWPPDAETEGRAQGEGGRRPPFLVLLGIATLIGVVAATVLVLSGANDAGEDSVGPSGGATLSPPSASAQARTPGPPSATPTPQTPGGTLGLQYWDPTSTQWKSGSVSEDAAYFEGDVMPFLATLEAGDAGEDLKLRIAFSGCDVPPGQSFDYLGDVASSSFLSLSDELPPRPDVTAPVPTDPTLGIEPASRGQLLLWGGTFARSASWTAADQECEMMRVLEVVITARSDVLRLAWGGHLASSDDWPGQGAAGAPRLFEMTVEVESRLRSSLTVGPGSVQQ